MIKYIIGKINPVSLLSGASMHKKTKGMNFFLKIKKKDNEIKKNSKTEKLISLICEDEDRSKIIKKKLVIGRVIFLKYFFWSNKEIIQR